MTKKVYGFILCVLTVFSLLLSNFALMAFASDYNVSTMHTGVDNNSFNNNSTCFVREDEKSKYYVSKKGLNRLLEGESEDVQNLILSQTLTPFYGSCYGISSVMALSYIGKIKLPDVDFYTSNIRTSKSFRNIINYYQLSQYCENKTAVKTMVVTDGKAQEDPLKQIVEYAKVGTPFLIGFRTADFAHEVVGCGYEHTEEGSHKIFIIDPEQKKDFMYLIISADYTSWAFEESLYNTEDIITLDFITLDAFSKLDLNQENESVYSAVGSSAHYDILCTDTLSSFVITNEKGEALTVQNGFFSGDMNYRILKYIACAGENYNTKIVLEIDDSNSYNVQNNGEQIDVTVVGDNNLFFSVQGKNIKSIDALEGMFTLKGENMEYSVSALSTEKNVQMMNINGADPEKVVFQTKDGVTVADSENGKTHVSLVSKGKIYDGECTMNEGNTSIIYSMIVKKEKKTSTGSSLIKTVVLGFIAIVFVITLYFTLKKYTGKKKDGAKNG